MDDTLPAAHRAGDDEADFAGNPPAESAASPPAAVPAAAPGGALRRGWTAFRRWRRSRPFWGGLLVLLAGTEILLSIRAPLPVVMHIGLQGLAGYLVPSIMVICGLLLWFHPVQRVFYSVVAVLMALASWLTSNLGGFIIGILLGLIGGSLAFGWQPGPRPGRRRARPAG